MVSQIAHKSDEYYMSEALVEAQKAYALDEVPIGAVVVYEGEIIARAGNTRESELDPAGHAEFQALMQASRKLGRWRLTGCTVYVTLEPCIMCAGLMINARIDRCVFAAPDPKAGALGSLYQLHQDERLNHSFEVSQGVFEQESSQLLKDFFGKLRRRNKKRSE